ncbi:MULTISPECIES: hypothetical protein [unclassified Thioalkalivibrio]|uniref:hypothetical protein n=1 Tax=unclassified Thioalkalivibrio TaxID=2621013 RepID=UPI000378B080|nr:MULTISPECIES: hypothetical protein [unclassified Thioalkalivibrio]
MQIADYSMQLSSQRFALEATRREARMTVVEGSAVRPRQGPEPPANPAPVARALQNSAPGVAARAPFVGVAPADSELTSVDQLRTELLRLILERFTGREIRVIDPADLKPADTPPEPLERPVARPPRPAAGLSVAWSVEQTRVEVERTSFQAQGRVHTADGKTIDLDIALTMSREFIEHSRLQGGMDAELHDPLVINFDAPAAALTDTRFEFDLDADGSPQQVAFLQPGSGFLAIDRSGSGQVDDGSELFGPLTGDGFAELRRFDHDGNGWIDAADPVYDRLRVWTRDAQGRDQLLALGEVGVGAIYLGHVSTPFDLRRGGDNSLLGQVQSTGVWVGEDGRSGSVQQIDLSA